MDPTRLLLTFNVSVNLGDKYHKNTALHWAVLAGNTTVISLLLEANTNVDAQNIKVSQRSKSHLGPRVSRSDSEILSLQDHLPVTQWQGIVGAQNIKFWGARGHLGLKYQVQSGG